ncbi:hypothetical protein J7337_001653 [Fusarium musae]|uniref:BTB domain-containing protein n=1 Tax=Fusarium musae TaxID=1042133 RepID=A0A9P8DU08_9HYPO|nr:hypothetical protein J7337_001653 [Fusarium musae]KAG9508093.1 hypothetical protein J7337_001653 [Fusarium musae]
MTKSISYIIDPDGDFEVLLKQPNSHKLVPYVPSDESEDPMNKSTVARGSLHEKYHVFDDLLSPAQDEKEEDPGLPGTKLCHWLSKALSTTETPSTSEAGTPPEDEVHMRVSSRHLNLASRVFRTLSQGLWAEASSTSLHFGNPLRQITAVDWDAVALAIVLDIIHGRHGNVPRVVDLRLMTHIATIVDFYECHEVVKIFSETWYKNMSTEFEDEYSHETLLWLSVSWVLPNQEVFDRAAQAILKHMDGRQLSADNLPLHEVLPKIEEKRLELINQIVRKFYDLLDTLPDSDYSCDWHKFGSPTCDSIALSILVRELDRLGSSDRRLVAPFNGYSITSLIQLVNDIPESIAATTEEYDHYHDVSVCSVRGRMRHVLGDVKAKMSVWTLDLDKNVRGD